MEVEKLERFIKGWIIGDFQPTLFNSKDFEIAIKTYKAGDMEKRHFHKIAKEWTVIVEGKVKMNDLEYVKGDIIIISPGETTDFLALEETVTVVVKIPSVSDDKFIVEKPHHD
jgi:hypothetical protein